MAANPTGPTELPLEPLLRQLLVPDNDTIKQATQLLQEQTKRPENLGLIPALSDVLRGSALPEVRHVASVLLRRRVQQYWMRLTLPAQQHLKMLLLDTVVREPERPVRQGIAGIVG